MHTTYTIGLINIIEQSYDIPCLLDNPTTGMIQINVQFNIGCVKFSHYITLDLVLVLILVLIFRYVL